MIVFFRCRSCGRSNKEWLDHEEGRGVGLSAGSFASRLSGDPSLPLHSAVQLNYFQDARAVTQEEPSPIRLVPCSLRLVVPGVVDFFRALSGDFEFETQVF